MFPEFIRKYSKHTLIRTLVGFCFFLLVAAIVMFVLESPEKGTGFNSFMQSLWFSIVTVTTVGYGDISPASTIGKIAAVVIMIVGIGYTMVLTANITSWLVERSRENALGLVPIQDVTGHFLVCGWRSDMSLLLKEILARHGKTSDYLVLVNNVAINEVVEMRQDPELNELRFFRGDDTSIEILMNVGATTAERVLILADERRGNSPEGIDFQSVLTALAMEKLNPHCYSIVEVVEPKFAQYLEQAKVEEIVLNRFNARALICNIAILSGMYNIYKKLFNLDSGLLAVENISKENFGKSYARLKADRSDIIIIGLLENTGILDERKREKIVQIRKNNSIQKAVKELVALKGLKGNQPLIHPPPNYIVRENSSIIILKVEPGIINDQIISDNDQSWAVQPPDIHPSPRTTHKESVPQWIAREMINILSTTNTWAEFHEILKRKGLEVYIHKNQAVGVRYHERKYRFKTLGISNDLVVEIDRYLKYEDYLQAIGNPETKLGVPPVKCKTLGDFVKEYKITQPFEQDDATKKRGRLMICGWKDQLIEMIEFLIEQQKHSPSVDWSEITVVADIDRDRAENFHRQFKNHPRINLVTGDHADKHVLQRAGIIQTTKVVLLAETDFGKSFEEIDAKTALASMLIESLNKHAYKVVEILDRKYEHTLQQSKAEEIVLIDEFSRVMLVNGSHGTGVSNVIRSMINLDSNIVQAVTIPAEFLSLTFAELLSKTLRPGMQILGLLEGSGNAFQRKSAIIRQAQVESRITDAVNSLKQIKEIENNKVLIAPSADHIITADSKLIVLKTTEPEEWDQYEHSASTASQTAPVS